MCSLPCLTNCIRKFQTVKYVLQSVKIEVNQACCNTIKPVQSSFHIYIIHTIHYSNIKTIFYI